MKFVPSRWKHSSFCKTGAFHAVKSVRQNENLKEMGGNIIKENPRCEFYLFYSSTLWPWLRLDRLNRFQPFCFFTEDLSGSPSPWITPTILFLLLTFRRQLFFKVDQILSFLCDALLPPTVSSVECIPLLPSQHDQLLQTDFPLFKMLFQPTTFPPYSSPWSTSVRPLPSWAGWGQQRWLVTVKKDADFILSKRFNNNFC